MNKNYNKIKIKSSKNYANWKKNCKWKCKKRKKF